MLIFALLPVIAFFLILLIIYSKISVGGRFTKLRVSLLYAILFHQAALLLITEILSTFSLLTFTPLLSAWLLFILLLGGYCRFAGIKMAGLREIFSDLTASVRMHWTGYVIACFVLGSFIIGLLYPPNNYDSMTYHLARVAHWVQNGNVSLYPSHIMRQLVMQPLGEYGILHAQLLTGGDRLAYSIQLFYYMGCISTVTLITGELGGSRQQQSLSALLCAMIPMAVLQSNTTQNDVAVAFFLLAFAWLSIRLMKRVTPLLLFSAGLALGLAFLTKGTAYIFALPFICLYPVSLFKQLFSSFPSFIKRSLQYACIVLIALAVNSSFFYRNFMMTGSILGNGSDFVSNTKMDTKSFLVVATKNMLNHIPIKDVTPKLTSIGSALNIDIEDPQVNFSPTNYMMDRFFYQEDYMQNFLHTILITLLGIYFLFRSRFFTRQQGYYTWYVISLFLTGILFCLLLKWQPWSNRLETPLFMLFSVFLGMEIGRMYSFVRMAVSIALIYFAGTAFLHSERRPVLPLENSIFKKDYASFIYSPSLLDTKAYFDTSHYSRIGLVLELDDWDYPYYRMLANGPGKKRVLEHVLVTNESKMYTQPFLPELIISKDKKKDRYLLGQQEYIRTTLFPDSSGIYLPKAGANTP